jgi:hypothetical protein
MLIVLCWMGPRTHIGTQERLAYLLEPHGLLVRQLGLRILLTPAATLQGHEFLLVGFPH